MKGDDRLRLRMRSREGFTLVEVLVASIILSIALFGIVGAAYNVLRQSSTPNKVEIAAQLASERLKYFRSQSDPYFAVGGTYYAPPTSPDEPDFGIPPYGDDVNVICNSAPQLFVREYLYDTEERKYRQGLQDQGLTNQTDRFAVGQDYGKNEIPPTPYRTISGATLSYTDKGFETGTVPAGTQIDGIVPNPDTAALSDVYTTNQGPGTYNALFCFAPAPRANDSLREGSDLPPDVAYVREVWIQTSNPHYRNIHWPANFAEPTLINFGQITAPQAQVALPPYVIAVTVRVFAIQTAAAKNQFGHIRIKKLEFNIDDPVDGIKSGSAGYDVATQVTGYDGRGYDPSHPLAEDVGYYALQRSF